MLESVPNGASLAYTQHYTLANGMLISQTIPTADNPNTPEIETRTALYFLTDAQGSTRALTEADGDLRPQQYSYDAFGNLQGGVTELSAETKYLYTGQQFDFETDLYSLRARYYDPSIGRFLSRDTWAYDYGNPIELNRYVYAAGNPTKYTDPSGNSIIGWLKTQANSVKAGSNTRIGGGALLGGTFSAIAASLIYTQLIAKGHCGDISVGFWEYVSFSAAFGAAVGAALGALPPAWAIFAATGLSLLGGIPSAIDMQMNGRNPCNEIGLVSSIIGAIAGGFGMMPPSGGAPLQFAGLNVQIMVSGANAAVELLSIITVGGTVVIQFPLYAAMSSVDPEDAEESGTGSTTGGSPDYPEFLLQYIDDILSKIPDEWGPGRPNKKLDGWRWIDPENPNRTVRIDDANPTGYPHQQIPHVRVTDGAIIGRSGNRITSGIRGNEIDSHIPLSDWLTWSQWNHP